MAGSGGEDPVAVLSPPSGSALSPLARDGRIRRAGDQIRRAAAESNKQATGSDEQRPDPSVEHTRRRRPMDGLSGPVHGFSFFEFFLF
jgi:hypothetical protein